MAKELTVYLGDIISALALALAQQQQKADSLQEQLTAAEQRASSQAKKSDIQAYIAAAAKKATDAAGG